MQQECVEAGAVGVRARKEGDIGQMALTDFASRIKDEVENFTR